MNATDMTKGKPMKLLFLFSLPLMFGNVFQQLYTVVDTMIVGQTLGVSALAALGAAESLGWMSLGSIQGLTQGFSIRMAQQFGAKDEDGLHQAVGHSIVLSALLAVLLTIVFQAAVRPVLAILQTPEDIKPDTILYLRILFAGIPIVVAYNLLASMLRAIGDSKTPLIATAIAAASNIVLDLLFVCVFGWGIAGASLVATFFITRNKNKKIEAEKQETISKIKRAISSAKECRGKIADLRGRITDLRYKLIHAESQLREDVYGADYMSLSEDAKLALGALVNNTLSLSELLNKTID